LHRLRAYKNRARTESARKRGMGREKARQDVYFALLMCTEQAGVTNVVHDRCAGLRHLKATRLVGAGLRIRDAGQRNRHGPKEPPGPFYEARIVGAGPARERERSDRPDTRETSDFSTNSVSGILRATVAGRQSRPFACKASSYNPGFVERFGASDDRGAGSYPRSESVFCPSGTLENRTFDREPPGTGSRRSRKGRTQTRDPDGGPQPHTPASPDGGAGHYQ